MQNEEDDMTNFFTFSLILIVYQRSSPPIIRQNMRVLSDQLAVEGRIDLADKLAESSALRRQTR